jgi:hypothetical protein
MLSQLEQAYQLIQGDQDDEALDILYPLLEKDPDNTDAWWLVAYAADDPHEARRALINVLMANPNHTQARRTLDELNAAIPLNAEERALLAKIPAPGQIQTTPAHVSDLPAPEDDILTDLLPEEPVEEREGLGRFAQVVFALIAILIAVILGTALLNEEAGEANPGKADLAQLKAQEPSDRLAGLNLGPTGEAILSETSLGPTLFVQICVCTSPACDGPSAANLPQIVVERVHQAVEQVEAVGATEDISGVGVNVTACQNGDDTLYRGYTSLENAQSANSLDFEAMRSTWIIES